MEGIFELRVSDSGSECSHNLPKYLLIIALRRWTKPAIASETSCVVWLVVHALALWIWCPHTLNTVTIGLLVVSKSETKGFNILLVTCSYLVHTS